MSNFKEIKTLRARYKRTPDSKEGITGKLKYESGAVHCYDEGINVPCDKEEVEEIDAEVEQDIDIKEEGKKDEASGEWSLGQFPDGTQITVIYQLDRKIWRGTMKIPSQGGGQMYRAEDNLVPTVMFKLYSQSRDPQNKGQQDGQDIESGGIDSPV